MNICLLNRFFDFRGTGITRIATEVSKELVKQGHSVTKYATNGKSLYSYALHTAIKPIFTLPRNNIDVYHALATMEAMWLPRDKSIATYLDLFTTTNPDRAGAGMGYSRWKLAIGKRYFELGSQIAARCRYLVCISEKTKQDVIEHINPDRNKLKVIRLGISSNLKPKPCNRNRFTIGTLSQLDKRKRIDLLIKQFKASRIDADLLIAGEGTDRKILESMADSDKRIHFLGLVPEDKLADFYNSLNLFAFPTAIEGYGLPAVEAMACNKPVVILDDSIIPDEIKERCIIADNLTSLFDNYNEIGKLINKVNYNDNLNFAQSHSWADCVSKYIELYKEICND